MNIKVKWLLLLLVMLIFTNAISLYFLLNRQCTSSKSQDRRSVILNFLKKDVGFSDIQLKQFDSLSNLHRTNTRPLYEKSAEKKVIILKRAASEQFSDLAIDSAAADISKEQNVFEVAMLQHLRTIRALCSREQLPKFDSGFYSLIIKRPHKSADNTQKK